MKNYVVKSEHKPDINPERIKSTDGYLTGKNATKYRNKIIFWKVDVKFIRPIIHRINGKLTLHVPILYLPPLSGEMNNDEPLALYWILMNIVTVWIFSDTTKTVRL